MNIKKKYALPSLLVLVLMITVGCGPDKSNKEAAATPGTAQQHITVLADGDDNTPGDPSNDKGTTLPVESAVPDSSAQITTDTSDAEAAELLLEEVDALLAEIDTL